MTDDTQKILVVEDERDLAELYTAWLEDEYDVETAFDGTQALETLDESIDMVLLDRRIPGISGDEVLAAIKETGHNCRVAIVTAVEPDFDIIGMGFDDYLIKPVDRGALLRTVERLFTRNMYRDKLDELASLVSKKTALETEKTMTQLEENEEFQNLKAQIKAVKSDVDPIAEEFEDDDIAAVLRDPPASNA